MFFVCCLQRQRGDRQRGEKSNFPLECLLPVSLWCIPRFKFTSINRKFTPGFILFKPNMTTGSTLLVQVWPMTFLPPHTPHLPSLFSPGFAGTPGYLSPEVLRKDPYGKAVDMWACGKYSHSLRAALQKNLSIDWQSRCWFVKKKIFGLSWHTSLLLFLILLYI